MITLLATLPRTLWRPTSPRGRGDKCARPAFTLLELMLVLVLIVVAMAIALPSLNRSLKTWELKSAADTILAECNRARSKAIRDGEIYVFRFAQQSGQYMSGPWLEGSELPDGLSVAQFENPIAPNVSDVDPTARDDLRFANSHKVQQLPEDVLFLGIQFETKAAIDGETIRAPDYEVLSGGQQVASTGWSAPILFYPDGTSSPAQIYLHNDRQQAIAITLRAMTGSGRVSDIETVGDFQP